MSEPSKPQLIKLSAVEIPPEAERFSIGIPGLDACLAEAEDSPHGLPPGTSILLSGMPGGGKSTIATYMAASQHGRESLILHGEEKAERVAARWKRLGLKDADPYVVPLRAAEDALAVIRDINAMPDGKGLGMVLIDSVQTLTLGGSRKYDAQYEAAEMLVGQVTSANGCVVFVSHVSKTGKDHAGAAALAHLVDIHIHLTANAKKSERVLEVRKNRMGRAGFQVPLNILQNGLSVGVPAPLSISNGLPAARNALEACRNLAMKLLLEGKHVNGYDFLEHPEVATNGNMWRGGLEMAAKTLANDGFAVVQEKVNGRKGFRLENPPPKNDAGDVVYVTKKMKVNEANALVPAETPAATEGQTIVANGDIKPEFDPESVSPTPELPIEMS